MDSSRDERSDGFPPPRPRGAPPHPHRALAFASHHPRPARLAWAQSPERGSHARPPLVISDAEYRREMVLAGMESGLAEWGAVGGLLLAHPKWFGASVLAGGIGIVALGLSRHHVTCGAAAIAWGIALVLCERVPLQRAPLRLTVIVATMFFSLVLERVLRDAGVFG